MLLPSCISSNPLLMSGSGMVWVIIGSISILPAMYQSTIFGTSVRPRAPPKAVPRHTRPGTSWNGRGEISASPPAPAGVAAFERGAHQVDIADAFEAVVGAADLVGRRLGQVHQIGNELAADL